MNILKGIAAFAAGSIVGVLGVLATVVWAATRVATGLPMSDEEVEEISQKLGASIHEQLFG